MLKRNNGACTRDIKCGGRAPEALTLLWCTARPLGRVVRLLLEAANLLDDVERVVVSSRVVVAAEVSPRRVDRAVHTHTRFGCSFWALARRAGAVCALHDHDDESPIMLALPGGACPAAECCPGARLFGAAEHLL